MQKIFNIVSEEEQLYDLNIQNNVGRGTLVEIHLADIHFGALDPKYQYDILEEQCFKRIENMYFDILSINGDLFEHKYMTNSDVVMYAVMTIDRIVQICRNKGATFVLLHGTAFHDANQLKLFYKYLKDPTIDIRIVEEVKFEYIKGAKILCIPELYGKGQDYYNNFLFMNGEYDSVFMHGVIKGAIYQAESQESGTHSDKAPTFTIDDFGLCKGPIISGHVHTAGCFNSYFYYCGSPYRWKFGEEEDKGFLVVLHNLDTNQHHVQLEPIKSFRYNTINLDHMLLGDPSKVLEYISSLQDNGIDYIRIEFGEQTNDKAIANIELVKQSYKTNSRVKIKSNNSKSKQQSKINDEALEKYKEYDYIIDKSLSEYDILTRYINQNEGYTYITVDELKSIIEDEF